METALYYLQSRYYNPEWGRYLNADAIFGKKGELLGHNLFSYCKNNAGFRPMEAANPNEETEEEREWSFDVMNPNQRYNREQKKKRNYLKSTNDSLVSSTALGIAESIGGEATLGYVRIPYGNMPIPIKLSTLESTGRLFKVAGIVSLYSSIQEDLGGNYSTQEAYIRTFIDSSSFVITAIALAGVGGWAAVGIGLGIGLVSEGIKYAVDLRLNKTK